VYHTVDKEILEIQLRWHLPLARMRYNFWEAEYELAGRVGKTEREYVSWRVNATALAVEALYDRARDVCH
jgi:hypothetical protein